MASQLPEQQSPGPSQKLPGGQVGLQEGGPHLFAMGVPQLPEAQSELPQHGPPGPASWHVWLPVVSQAFEQHWLFLSQEVPTGQMGAQELQLIAVHRLATGH